MSPVRPSDLPPGVRARLMADGTLREPGQQELAARGDVSWMVAHLLEPGPWSAALSIRVATRLRSKSNRRRYTSSQKERKSWRADRDFSVALAAVAAGVLPAEWQTGRREDPLVQRPSVVMAIHGFGRLDAANLTKSIPDALEGVCYLNDASVTTIWSCSDPRLPVGGLVAVATLPPGSDLGAQAAAVSELAARVRCQADDLVTRPAP